MRRRARHQNHVGKGWRLARYTVAGCRAWTWNPRKTLSGDDAAVRTFRYRYQQGSGPDLSDAALSERRREDRYQLGNQCEKSIRGRRSIGWLAWSESFNGQFAARPNGIRQTFGLDRSVSCRLDD